MFQWNILICHFLVALLVFFDSNLIKPCVIFERTWKIYVPTNWNWTGQVVSKVPRPYPFVLLGLQTLPLCIIFCDDLKTWVYKVVEPVFLGWGGVAITRAKIITLVQMVNFVLFSFLLELRFVSGVEPLPGNGLLYPLLPPLSDRISSSKCGWPSRPNHSWSWYHQAGLTDTSVCSFANETMLRISSVFSSHLIMQAGTELSDNYIVFVCCFGLHF